MISKRFFIAASMLVAVATANAQTGQTPYTLSVGWNYLTDKDSRDQTKANGYTATLGYILPGLFKDMPNLEPSVELSYARNEGDGNKVDVAGLSFVVRTPFSVGEKGGFVPYAGLGIGIARGHISGDQIVILDNGSSGTVQATNHVSETKTIATGKILVGAKFSNNMFAEAAYNIAGKIEGFKSDSISVSVGIRF